MTLTISLPLRSISSDGVLERVLPFDSRDFLRPGVARGVGNAWGNAG